MLGCRLLSPPLPPPSRLDYGIGIGIGSRCGKGRRWRARQDLFAYAFLLYCLYYAFILPLSLASSSPSSSPSPPAASVSVSAASAASSFPALHPSDWQILAEVKKPTQRVCFQIAIRIDPSTLSLLESRLWNVSSPSHPSYGEYLSRSQLRALLEPSAAASRTAVLEWLHASPLQPIDNQTEATRTHTDLTIADSSVRISSTGDFLDVCSSVEQVERLFETKLDAYARKETTDKEETRNEHEQKFDTKIESIHNLTSLLRSRSSSVLSAPPALPAPSPTSFALRASTPLALPSHLLPHIDFVGGINTPIHRYKIKAISAKREERKEAQKVGTESEDSSCSIPAAYEDHIPPALTMPNPFPSPPLSAALRSSLTPHVAHLKAGNRQAYIRWSLGCDARAPSVLYTSNAEESTGGERRSCESLLSTFRIILQPMATIQTKQEKPAKGKPPTHFNMRLESLPLIAASLPFHLANCQAAEESADSAAEPQAAEVGREERTARTTCETIFPLPINDAGFWLTLEAELIPSISLPSSSSQSSPSSESSPAGVSVPLFLSSCVRGPLFGHELVSTSFLQSLYRIPPSFHSLRHENSTVAIVEFMETYWNDEDLQTYLTLMDRPNDKQGNRKKGKEKTQQQAEQTALAAGSSILSNASVVIPPRLHAPRLVGFNNDTEALLTGDEAQLDVQVVMGLLTSEVEAEDINKQALPDKRGLRRLSASDSVAMWNVAGREPENSEEPFLRWVLAVQELEHPPLVYSLSYGDIEEELPEFYVRRLNTEFLKLGLRGLTVIFPAGDKGIASDMEPMEKACERSRPEFPVSSPIACSAEFGGKITTGGGFSNRFERPHYQHKQVEQYITNRKEQETEGEQFFNKAGRGYPDLSVYGTHFVTINDGDIVPAAGTSASVPVVAAMVALWNDIRLLQGAPPLGLIGPFLYSLHSSHPHAFHDIVHGNNRCRLEEQKCCKKGFQAELGWDATSGLGSPRFDVIASILQQGDVQTEEKQQTKQQGDKRREEKEVEEERTEEEVVPSSSLSYDSSDRVRLLLLTSFAFVIVLALFCIYRVAQSSSVSEEEQQRLIGHQ